MLIPKSDASNLNNYVCTNYMGWNGNTYEKQPPGQISKSVIQDELRIEQIEENKIHFRVVIKSHTYKVRINGKQIPVIAKNQTVQVKDYDYLLQIDKR